MQIFFIGKMLCGGQCKSGSDNTFYSRMVSMIHEKDYSVHWSVNFEISFEKSSSCQVYSHCCEHNSKIFIGMVEHIFTFDESSLSTNLGTNFIVGKSCSWEQWNLLSSCDWSHAIYCGNSSLNHFFWINSLIRIDWLTLKLIISIYILSN